MPTATNATTPSWLNTGDNAWQLTGASLVALQSVPGFVVLYSGWVNNKWVINSGFMALYAFAAVLVTWVLWAYKMGFGKQLAPFVGIPGPLMTITNQLEQANIPSSGDSPNFPLSTMAYFQFVFAAITVVIIAGSFLARMTFRSWMVFVPLYITFCYTVGAYSLWGGGFLSRLGVIDYSGGYVIHLSSGTAGYIGAYIIGPRLQADREVFTPNNIPAMMVGAGIIWIGWNGFNGGDPYMASPDAGVAVINTNIATAFSLISWLLLDYTCFGYPSIVGAIQGMLSGLVGITPAAGVVNGWGAVIIGVLSGTVPWFSMCAIPRLQQSEKWSKYLWKWPFDVDDALKNFETHALAGFIGGMSVGVLATEEGCAAFGLSTPGGAINGNWRQVRTFI